MDVKTEEGQLTRSIPDTESEPKPRLILRGIEAAVGEEDVTVYPLVRKRYRQMVKMLAGTVKKVIGLVGVAGIKDAAKAEGNIMERLDELIALVIDDAGDELGTIYGWSTNLDPEFFEENLTFDQEIELIQAVFKANRIEQAIKNAQGMGSMFAGMAAMAKK